MIPNSRRRTSLGDRASGALPILWAAMEARGWTDANLAEEMGESRAIVSRLLYGDRPASRRHATRLLDLLAIPLHSWDEPCPVKRRRHGLRATASTTVAAVEDCSLHGRGAA